ncbi:hypothetical protein TMRH483_00477 [Qipengyuania sp. 483]
MFARALRSFARDTLLLGSPALACLFALDAFEHGYAFAMDLIPTYALSLCVSLALMSLWDVRSAARTKKPH